MRKLLTILGAILRQQKPWDPAVHTSAPWQATQLLGVSAVRFCSEVTIAKSTQTRKAGRSVPGSQFRVLRAYPKNPAARTAITPQAKRFQWFG
jgi:hypothetical protein